MEFFIKNVQIRPHLILTTYPKVFVVIYEILKEGEYPRAGVAINAIISLASSWDCKIALNVPTTIKTCGFQGEVYLHFSISLLIIIYIKLYSIIFFNIL